MAALAQEPDYALGHTERELERLNLQARLYEPFTRQRLLEAGLEPGMRVLDVGCGAGHVAFLAAELVGPMGEVLGVERAPEALARARDGAAMRGLANLSFLQADLEDLAPGRPFDAVVGRMMLLFVPDPTATLRRLARQLRPGGIVFFQELDMGGLRTWPARPLLDRCRDDVVTTSGRAGVNTRMGLDLYSTYVAAGLPSPTMRLDAIVGGGADFPGPTLVVEVLRSLLPLMERHGMAGAAEPAIDTLEERVREEFAAGGGIFVGPSLIAAWAP